MDYKDRKLKGGGVGEGGGTRKSLNFFKGS